jgi:ATP-dependent exoDNAse (exonuclease V) alpha subunit
VNLSPEQQAAADRLVAGVDREPVQTLGGYAGTGKTTLVAFLHHKLPEFAVCAFTGKAADVLRRKGLPAATIHGTIYRPVQTARGVQFALKPPDALGATGFIVDEASMVGKDIFRDLRSFGLPIIAVGDHGQLPPVGEDAGLMRDPDVRLETIHRNAGPIAHFAEHLRKGGDAAAWRDTGSGVWVLPAKQIDEGRLSRADQVICAFNRTRVGLNRTIRRKIGRPAGDEPVVGDRVMCLRNDRAANVFNGQQGVVAELNPRAREMVFRPTFGEELAVHYHAAGWNAEKPPKPDEGARPVPGRDVPFDFAYAITAHKSQGDEWAKVVVFEERCGLWEHARWAYTAASRAKEALVWLTG